MVQTAPARSEARSPDRVEPSAASQPVKTLPEMTDAEAGRLLKHFAEVVGEVVETNRLGLITMQVAAMVEQAQAANAEEMTQTVRGLTFQGIPQGDWSVTLRRIA